MAFHRCLILVTVSSLIALFSSCTGPGKKGSKIGTEGAVVGEGDAVSSAGFLKTNYQPLVKWLDDERFKVDYKHMTPQLIFDQMPLNSIYYETSNLPTKAAPFNFASSAVSRRELLHRIANHWKLKMSFALDAAGNPTAVKVEG